MARPEDEDAPWTRQLLVGAGVLVVVALVIGGVVSVVALGAAKVSGIESAGTGPGSPASLYLSDQPTTKPETFPDPAAPRGSATPPPSPTGSETPKKKVQVITLHASPAKVAPNQRINFSGVYRGVGGARLQVQRFDSGWQDFPVSASVSGGLFRTYIVSGRAGTNRFRVVDKASGRHSNAVAVRIG
ncbi:MAG: hypothetical protein ACJ786_13245 [Catenulispora sp.]